MTMHIEPVTLEGRLVRLEPLGLQHVAGLYAAAQDPSIWLYMYYDPSHAVADTEYLVTAALQEQQAGTELPFAIIERATNTVVGSTRYLEINRQHHGIEIGWTWLGQAVRRTGVNTECKYLLLRHAFEKLGAIRVQLKTDSRNLRSQRAIERLGAVKEGILRNHKILSNGYYRHSVYYSIIDSEWPAVKAGLEEKMRREA